VLTTARTIFSLIIGTCLAVLGNGLMGTTVALRASAQFSATAAALILAAYYLGLALGPLPLRMLIARIGHIRVFAGSAAASSASFLALPLWHDAVPWMVARGIGGCSMAGMFIALESWLHAKATPDTRGKILAVYISAAQLSLAGGQLLLFAYPPSDERVFTLAALLHAVALIPIALTYIEPPPPPSSARFGVRALFAVAPLGILGCLGSGLIVGALMTLGPVYVMALGHDVGRVAIFMLVLTVSGLPLQWTAGHLSDRIGRRPVLVMAGVGLTLAAAPLALGQAVPYAWILILGAAMGSLAFLIYPLATAYANDLVEPDQLAAVSGTLIVTFAVGALGGPLLGSVATWALGTGGPFWLVALVALLLTLACAYRLLVRRAIPHDQWTTYAPAVLPQATPGGEMQPDAP
jgi:MFS family permease